MKKSDLFIFMHSTTSRHQFRSIDPLYTEQLLQFSVPAVSVSVTTPVGDVSRATHSPPNNNSGFHIEQAIASTIISFLNDSEKSVYLLVRIDSW